MATKSLPKSLLLATKVHLSIKLSIHQDVIASWLKCVCICMYVLYSIWQDLVLPFPLWFQSEKERDRERVWELESSSLRAYEGSRRRKNKRWFQEHILASNLVFESSTLEIKVSYEVLSLKYDSKILISMMLRVLRQV